MVHLKQAGCEHINASTGPCAQLQKEPLGLFLEGSRTGGLVLGDGRCRIVPNDARPFGSENTEPMCCRRTSGLTVLRFTRRIQR